MSVEGLVVLIIHAKCEFGSSPRFTHAKCDVRMREASGDPGKLLLT